jgi:hypothetical protein
MPETGIEEMEYGVLSSSDVFIDHSPVFECFTARESLMILGVHIAEIVPARSSPLRHRVRLSFPHEILCEPHMYPFTHGNERRIPISGWLISIHFWKGERET